MKLRKVWFQAGSAATARNPHPLPPLPLPEQKARGFRRRVLRETAPASTLNTFQPRLLRQSSSVTTRPSRGGGRSRWTRPASRRPALGALGTEVARFERFVETVVFGIFAEARRRLAQRFLSDLTRSRASASPRTGRALQKREWRQLWASRGRVRELFSASATLASNSERDSTSASGTGRFSFLEGHLCSASRSSH